MPRLDLTRLLICPSTMLKPVGPSHAGAKGVLLASGDVHFAEISRAVCRMRKDSVDSIEERQLWEITTSGEGSGLRA